VSYKVTLYIKHSVGLYSTADRISPHDMIKV